MWKPQLSEKAVCFSWATLPRDKSSYLVAYEMRSQSQVTGREWGAVDPQLCTCAWAWFLRGSEVPCGALSQAQRFVVQTPMALFLQLVTTHLGWKRLINPLGLDSFHLFSFTL